MTNLSISIYPASTIKINHPITFRVFFNKILFRICRVSTMGDWEQILFERRVLWWTTLLVLVDTGLWLVALATPYWVIHIAGSEEGHLDTDSDSQALSSYYETVEYCNFNKL